MVNLATLAFWRKKDLTSPPEQNRIVPLPPIKGKPLNQESVSQEETNKAKDALKLLLLERQILASAVTTIFESESKGLINQLERDHLVEKYKVDLKRLEKTIEGHQRIVDLYELENARQELVKNFNQRMLELETRIQNLKLGNASTPQVHSTQIAPIAQVPAMSHSPNASVKRADAEINDAEKRIEQIRSEILEAMDRLEQIETEG